MSLETAIFTLLTGNANIKRMVTRRVYPIVLPQNCEFPAISYQRVTGARINDLSGYGNLQNALIQVDTWATSYDEVKELGAHIHTAMNGSGTFKALLITDSDGYEADAGLFRLTMDFSAWGT
jgi:hypothetical protein